jgi:hypothetical protein
MLVQWFRSGDWLDLDLEWRQIYHQGISLRSLGRFFLAFSPIITFAIWKFSYFGLAFSYIESNFFGRGFLSLGYAFYAWAESFREMIKGLNPQHSAYYFTEFLGLTIAVIACFAVYKKFPEIAWFSIAVILVSWGSGPAQGIHRYVLAAPAVFIALSQWGENPVFDRAWTILSIMLMGFLSMMFAFNMWVA